MKIRCAPLVRSPFFIAAALATCALPALAKPQCPLANTVKHSALRELCAVKNGMARISVGHKWGVVDTAGRVVIAPQFDALNDFSEGYAGAMVNDQWSLINRQGEWAVKPSFDSLESMEGGLIAAGHGGKHGFIDATGTWIVPAQYDSVGRFSGPVAVVDAAGKAYPCPEGAQRFTRAAYMTIGGDTDNGIMQVDLRTGAVKHRKSMAGETGTMVSGLMPAEQDGKWGLMDEHLVWVVKPVFDDKPTPLMKGKDLAGWITSISGQPDTGANARFGLLSAGGREIVKPRYTSLALEEAFGLLLATENGYLQSVLDAGGEVLIAPVHAKLSWRGDGWFSAEIDSQHGLLDQRGEWVVKPSRFEFERDVENRLPVRPFALSRTGDEKQLMDFTGRISTRQTTGAGAGRARTIGMVVA